MARIQNITKWLTKLVNSMNESIFLMIDESEWRLFLLNTNGKLVSTSHISICTFVQKLLNDLWLDYKIAPNG